MDLTKQDSLQDIVSNYSTKFKDIPITLIISDTNYTYTIANRGVYERNKYVIILAPYNENLVESSGNTYFISNISELCEILDYMLKHTPIFVTPQTDDVFDHCEIVSLDELTMTEIEDTLDKEN